MDKNRITELFISKYITISMLHRGKYVDIDYVILSNCGDNNYREFSLRSKRYPPKIKNMENIILKVTK